MTPRVAMIGAGNMAQALIGGMLDQGMPTVALIAADPSDSIRDHVRSQFGIDVVAENALAVAAADCVILAVKPQVMDAVLNDLSTGMTDAALVISVAAGISVQTIQNALGLDRAVVRAMPNTPALLGLGATGLYAATSCSSQQRTMALSIFQAVGQVVEVQDEAMMDAVTAVSGSGPAYFFALTEALQCAGQRAGLDADTAAQLAQQTAVGAGAMLAQAGRDAATLRAQVTSPGGTTAAALDSLNEHRFIQIVEQAVTAAVERGRVLGQSNRDTES